MYELYTVRSFTSPPKREDYASDVEFDSAKSEYEQRRYENRYYENQSRLDAEDQVNREKLKLELANRYFIALATLSAATITLLIQHVLLSFEIY